MVDYKKKVEMLKEVTGLNEKELLEMLSDRYLKEKTPDQIWAEFLRGSDESKQIDLRIAYMPQLLRPG